jgi:hypothetical protein
MEIFLIGKVPKGDKEQKNFDNWRIKYQNVAQKFFDAEFIDPYDRNLDESDFLAVVGWDCRYIKESAFVIVNAENKLGAGSSQEMVIAKYFNKPVVTVLPENSHHRRSNIIFREKVVDDWIQPFIFAFSDFIIEDIKEIGGIKDKIFNSKIKNISVIDDAIKYIDSK